jgi:hypothetical protein
MTSIQKAVFVGKPIENEVKSLALILAASSLQEQAVWKQFLTKEKCLEIHSWVLVMSRSAHALPESSNYVLKKARGKQPAGVVFHFDKVQYQALLIARSKLLDVVFPPHLIQPNTLLMLLDCDPGTGHMMTANMSL